MLGLPELLIIMVVVLVLFGVGRISKLGGELGTAVSSFRSGVNSHKEPNESEPV